MHLFRFTNYSKMQLYFWNFVAVERYIYEQNILKLISDTKNVEQIVFRYQCFVYVRFHLLLLDGYTIMISNKNENICFCLKYLSKMTFVLDKQTHSSIFCFLLLLQHHSCFWTFFYQWQCSLQSSGRVVDPKKMAQD